MNTPDRQRTIRILFWVAVVTAVISAGLCLFMLVNNYALLAAVMSIGFGLSTVAAYMFAPLGVSS